MATGSTFGFSAGAGAAVGAALASALNPAGVPCAGVRGLRQRGHGGGRVSLRDPEPLIAVARDVGLDVQRFESDLADRGLLRMIARDHTEAVEKHGIFGTPTFVFETGNAAYLKTFIPPEKDSVAFFEHFVSLTSDMSFVGELKRPQPPWPKGAVG